MQFCSQCGTKRLAAWRFCPECRLEFSQPGHTSHGTRQSPFRGLAVFAVLLLVGVGTWLQILSPKARSGPSGSPGGGAGTAAGASLPEGHPPLDQIVLPDDVKQFIADRAAQVEQQPTDKVAWEQLGQVQYRAAQIDASYYPAALKSFRHVLELDPENANALRGIASVHYDLGEYGDAKPFLEKYLALRPDDPAAQTDLATVRLNVGDIEGAIADYRKIIEANPPFVQAHFNLGIALHRTGDIEGAVATFRQAREITTDERIRARLDSMIAQLEGASASPETATEKKAAAGGPNAAETRQQVAAGSSAFQKTVEEYFRTHAIMGEKIVAIEWPEAMTARVVVHDFPMNTMPPFAKSAFTARLQDTVRDAKAKAGANGTAEVAIVDSNTRTVMETIRE